MGEVEGKRMNVGELGKALQEARNRVNELDAKLKEAKKDQAKAEKDLLEAMLENGLTGMKLEDGSPVYIRRDLFVTKKGGIDRDAVLAYLRERDLDFVIRENYVAATVKAFIVEKEKQERNGDPEIPIESVLPDGFTEFFSVTESLRPIVRAAK
jgi:hypothetical protein